MNGEVPHGPKDSASDIFSAPAGLSISGFTVWRYEADGPSVPFGTPVSNLLYYNPGVVYVNSCSQFEGCPSRGAPTPKNPFGELNKVSSAGLSGATAIQWRAACAGGETCPASGASGSGSISAQYDVYAADIDLVDNAPPTVSGVGGPLVAGGALAGNQSISFNASDSQSGVYGGSLLVDGHAVSSRVLDTNGGACQSLGLTGDGQRSFEHAQPCKGSLSAGLTLDTSQLAAGQHSLELIVDDAAGNQAIAYNGTILIASASVTGGNGGGAKGGGAGGVSIGPGSPPVVRGPVNGTNASDQAALTARWVGTARQARTSRYGVANRVIGRLTTSAGQPISGALIDVFQTPAYDGARALRIGGVSTGPTGQWTLTPPRGVSSGVLLFVYRSHQNDTVAAASARLRLGVHAGIVLKITPRSASVGRKIFFSGVLRGAPIPRGGKQLVLEASSGGEWVQFNTIRTNAKGRYHSSYRFKFPGPVTYRFRVLSRYEADFPFLDGTSNVIHVHEH